ncbi:MAG: hypothetical protein DWQ31_15155 [Planctomycetota bacterium]|mgnify:CR=1 FL=1|nr:MAG: hypothetical protein DWQ31_15155 [Planctomycetota bacterium]REJ88303.1 MAG: hypothetical protein DWQ35_20210 [Planctomycetota bacterium]
MKKEMTAAVALATLLLALAGCTQGDTNASTDAAGQRYLLDAAPAGALEVLAARETVKNEDEIVVVGRIGGRMKPLNEDLAAFYLVDNSYRACSDIEGDECPTPWDYCCDSPGTKGQVLVTVVDENGQVVDKGARELLGLKELQTVVVRGSAERDDKGNLTILATGIFVKG